MLGASALSLERESRLGFPFFAEDLHLLNAILVT
jgi:hypothetical protein